MDFMGSRVARVSSVSRVLSVARVVRVSSVAMSSRITLTEKKERYRKKKRGLMATLEPKNTFLSIWRYWHNFSKFLTDK